MSIYDRLRFWFWVLFSPLSLDAFDEGDETNGTYKKIDNGDD